MVASMGPFVPSAVMRQLFRQLKAVFTSAPVLVHFDPAKPIRLDTNAFGYAIAGMIVQQAKEVREAQGGLSNYTECAAKGYQHPAALWLRSMLPAERNYTVGNQEMLTIVMSCRH